MALLSNSMVRVLGERDIPAALGLCRHAGWNQTAEDWRLLLALWPDGCLGIDCNGELAATTTLAVHCAGLGWVGMVLTHPEHRRRGLARRLVAHALELAERWGVRTLKLDATDQGRPLYAQMGFRDEGPIERWAGTIRGCRGGEGPVDFELDRRAFGVDRSRTLEALAARNPAIVAPGGFAMYRQGANAGFLGPVVAVNAETARDLIGRLPPGDYFWDLLPGNPEAVRLARDFGFEPRRRLARMSRGEDMEGDYSLIYAAGGFEIG